MCTIWYHKIRINKIMSLALNVRLDNRPAAFDELVRLCVVALQVTMTERVPRSVSRQERGNLLLGTLPGSARLPARQDRQWPLIDANDDARGGMKRRGAVEERTAGTHLSILPDFRANGCHLDRTH
jgi:hypothetical protein